MSGNKQSSIDRRSVLKGIGTIGAAAASGVAMSGSAAGVGSSAVFQYYHTPWTTIESNLSTIANQGYDAIQVPPAQFSRLYEYERGYEDGHFAPPLGYQPINHLDFNSVFGTESEYQSMVNEAHNQGLDVIADAVCNHVAAGGDTYDRIVDMDDIPHFTDEHIRPDTSCDYSDDDSLETCWLVGLRDIKQENDEARGELYKYIKKYNDMGVDGIRWDAAKHIQEWFFTDHANVWADQFGLYSVGEVLESSTDYCEGYADTGMSVTDFPLHYNLRDACKSGGDMRALQADAMVDRDPFRALTFVNNHDTKAPGLQKLAYAYVLTYEGYPRVYNNEIAIDDGDIRNLLWIRNNLAGGTAYERDVTEHIYSFERYGNLVTAINNSSSWEVCYPYTSWRDRNLNDYTGHIDDVYVDGNGYMELWVPPESWVVMAP